MKRKRLRSVPRTVTVEAWLFVIMLGATIWLYQSGAIAALTAWAIELGPLIGGFFAGAAFSTFVTTPFALAGFLELGRALTIPLWQVALGGAIGATIADLLLVKSIRSPLALLLVRAVVGHDTSILKSKVRKKPAFRWYAGLLGALLIAIPLPTDELGVIFLGASGLNAKQMTPIIFLADFVGIYAIIFTIRILVSA